MSSATPSPFAVTCPWPVTLITAEFVLVQLRYVAITAPLVSRATAVNTRDWPTCMVSAGGVSTIDESGGMILGAVGPLLQPVRPANSATTADATAGAARR